MAAFDDRKTKQKQCTVFMLVAADTLYLMLAAADTLYQTGRNIFLEVLLSSYDKNTNCKPYPHFTNRK